MKELPVKIEIEDSLLRCLNNYASKKDIKLISAIKEILSKSQKE
tara:strand:- start:397 stop:528 length:132 start_codon:yes stop_codon:yes gene_type:complete